MDLCNYVCTTMRGSALIGDTYVDAVVFCVLGWVVLARWLLLDAYASREQPFILVMAESPSHGKVMSANPPSRGAIMYCIIYIRKKQII